MELDIMYNTNKKGIMLINFVINTFIVITNPI